MSTPLQTKEIKKRHQVLQNKSVDEIISAWPAGKIERFGEGMFINFCSLGHIEMVNHLIENQSHYQIKIKLNLGLKESIENRHNSLARHLISLGAEPSQSCLCVSIASENFEMFDYLLSMGLKITDEDSVKMVSEVAKQQNTPAFNHLIKSGVNLYAENHSALRKSIYNVNTLSFISSKYPPDLLDNVLKDLESSSHMKEYICKLRLKIKMRREFGS